jgi:hypothetical protein
MEGPFHEKLQGKLNLFSTAAIGSGLWAEGLIPSKDRLLAYFPYL